MSSKKERIQVIETGLLQLFVTWKKEYKGDNPVEFFLRDLGEVTINRQLSLKKLLFAVLKKEE